MYIGYKEVQKGDKVVFFLQGAFGGEVEAASGQLLPSSGTGKGNQVIEYSGSHPAALPITTQSKHDLVQWLQAIIDCSNKTMQQQPANSTGPQNGAEAATAVVPKEDVSMEQEDRSDSDATASDSEIESDQKEEEEKEKLKPKKKKSLKNAVPPSGTAITITTPTTAKASTFHFVGFRDEVRGLSETGDPPRRMWQWLLRDAHGREHVAVETSKWEQGKKRFTYSAVPPFSQVKPMVCYNKRSVIDYLNQFVPPNARHEVSSSDGAGGARLPPVTGTRSNKKLPATGAKKTAKSPSSTFKDVSLIEKGKKPPSAAAMKRQQQQQQQQQHKDQPSCAGTFLTSTSKRNEARTQHVATINKQLALLRAECGVQYSLTLVGSDGSMEVITSKEDGAPEGGPLLKSASAAAPAATTDLPPESVIDGLIAAANDVDAPVSNQHNRRQKRQNDDNGKNEGAIEPVPTTKKFKRSLPQDPDVAALSQSMKNNSKMYLAGKWVRDPLPPHPLQETLENFQVAEDCGEENDHKNLLNKLTVSLNSVAAAGPGATSDPPKDSDVLVVVDSLPVPVSSTEVELQSVWGIDSYTRCLLLDALKCCSDNVLDEASCDEFIDTHLLPALNGLGDEGWDIQKALTKVERKSTVRDEVRAVAGRIFKAFEGLEEYFNDGKPVEPEARKHVRAHPKGEGVVVTSAGGLASGTFLGEYVGELYTAWRWAEREVRRRFTGGGGVGKSAAAGEGERAGGLLGAKGASAARKAATRMGASSEYYNIVLERPKTDPRGYDVMYVDAVQKGNFVSRLSHSCNPNCRSVTVIVGGRLTVGVWTTRDVAVGEELTVDFAGETDIEREGNAAVCLCGSAPCRGTFLYVTPGVNSPLNAVVASKLTMPDRCGMIVEAAADATLSFEDNERLANYGFKELMLFDGLPANSNEMNNGEINGKSGGEQVPAWLIKWLALALKFVEIETEELQTILATAPSPNSGSGSDGDSGLAYTEEEALAEIEHLVAGRIHSLAVALDRAKMFLRHQSEEMKATAPLRILDDEHVADYLWNGDASVARRVLGALSSYVKQKSSIRSAVGKRGSSRRATARQLGSWKVATKIEEEDENDEVDDDDQQEGRDQDDGTEDNTNNTPVLSSLTGKPAAKAIEDNTEEVDGSTDNSQLVVKLEEMLDNIEASTADAARTALRRVAALLLHAGPCHLAMHDVLQMYAGTRNFMSFTEYEAFSPTLANGNAGSKYRQAFLWGVLTNWHRSSDPVDTLIADRRGCVCLPDVEVCYMPAFSDGKYAAPGGDRSMLLRTLWGNPRAAWPRNCAANFTFRHNQKVFGTPQLDVVLREDGEMACRGLVEILQAVAK